MTRRFCILFATIGWFAACDGGTIDVVGNSLDGTTVRGTILRDQAAPTTTAQSKLNSTARELVPASSVPVIFNGSGRRATKTNASGQFETRLQEGAYTLYSFETDMQGMRRATATVQTVTGATTVQLDAAMLGAATVITGRIANPPPNGASVRLRQLDIFSRTDSSGRYTLQGVPPGNWTLVAASQNQLRAQTLVAVTNNTYMMQNLALTIETSQPTRTIRGCVAVPGVMVSTADFTAFDTSDADGCFSIDALRDATAISLFQAGATAHVVLLPQPPGAEIDLGHLELPNLLSGGTLSGRVVATRSGAPISTATITLLPRDQSLDVDENGAFKWTTASGCYSLHASAPAMGQSRRHVCVDPNQSVHIGNIGISSSGTCEPKLEVCNGLDDDCDGAVDENNICGDCVTETEICDGSDNDCDGFVDEKLSCPTTCSPTAEVCDGIDNDCDDSVDEANICRFYSDFGARWETADQWSATGGRIANLLLSAQGTTIYAAIEPVCPCDAATRSAIAFIDAQSLTEVTRVALPEAGYVRDLVFSTAGDIIAAISRNRGTDTSSGRKRLSRINRQTHAVTDGGTLPVSSDTQARIQLHTVPNSDLVYVLDQGPSQIHRVNTAAPLYLGSTPLGDLPSDMAYEVTVSRWYIAHAEAISGPPRLSRYDHPSFTLQGTVATTFAPVHLTKIDRRIYATPATYAEAATVDVIDLDGANPTYQMRITSTTLSFLGIGPSTALDWHPVLILFVRTPFSSSFEIGAISADIAAPDYLETKGKTTLNADTHIDFVAAPSAGSTLGFHTNGKIIQRIIFTDPTF